MKKACVALIASLILTLFAPLAAFAELTVDMVIDPLYALDQDGDGYFDDEGNFYLGADRVAELPFGSIFLYDTVEDTVIDGPVIMGDVDVVVPGGEGEFFVWGQFELAESNTEEDGIIEGANLARISSDGDIELYEFETDEDGGVNDMVYVEFTNELFIVGDFAEVNGETHRSIVCIDPTDGDFCSASSDWSLNEGLDEIYEGADFNDISYEPIDGVLIIAGEVVDYGLIEHESGITFLDITDPTTNIIFDYFDIGGPAYEIESMEFYNSDDDATENGTNEYLIMYGFGDSLFVGVFDDQEEGPDFVFLAEELEGYSMTRLDEGLAFALHDVDGGEFFGSYIATIDNGIGAVEQLSVSEVSASGSNGGIELEAFAVNSSSESFFAGDFSYDGGDHYYGNLMGLDTDSELVFIRDPLPHGVNGLAVNDDIILAAGNFQQANSEVYNRSIVWFNSDGTVNEDFDLLFIDEDSSVIDDPHFVITDDYLYVYEFGVRVVYDISEHALVDVPQDNLFRISLETGEIDDEFAFEYEEDIYAMYVSTDGSLYAVMDEDIDIGEDTYEDWLVKINELDGTIDADFHGSLVGSFEGFFRTDFITNIASDDEGSLYLNTECGECIGVTKISSAGVAEEVFWPVPGEEFYFPVLFVYDNFLVLADTEEDDFSLNMYDIETYEEADSELPNFEFTQENVEDGEATLRSVVKIGDELVVTGRFDSVTNTETDDVYDALNVAFFDPETGEIIEKELFTSLYTDDVYSTTLKFVTNGINRAAFYGDFSYNLTGAAEESLTDNAFGMLMFDIEGIDEEEVEGSGSGRSLISSGGAAGAKAQVDDGYAAEVQRVKDEGIVTKDFTSNANKCEILVMMGRTFDWPVDSTITTSKFTDVPEWCAPYSAYGESLGIVEGRATDRLGMETPVTRFEVVVMLYRYLTSTGYEFDGSSEYSFNDTIVPWAQTAVDLMAKEGFIKGFANGTFGGELNILKQDAGVILLRIRDGVSG